MVNFNQKIKVDKKLFLFKTIILSCEEVDIRKKKEKKEEEKGRKLFKIKYRKNQVVNVNYKFFFPVIP